MTLLEVEYPTVDSDDEKVACPEGCGKLVTPRGLTRHLNSAHAGGNVNGDGVTTKAKERTTTRRGRKRVGGLSSEVSEGLTSFAGKVLFLVTLILAWAQLRRARVPDPDGDIAETMAMSDDEAVAIGRPLARLFASTENGKRLAPVIVQNEDIIDAVFAGWEWYKRNRMVWDQLTEQGYTTAIPTQPETQAMRYNAEGTTNGSNGQATSDRIESAPEYVPPGPLDFGL